MQSLTLLLINVVQIIQAQTECTNGEVRIIERFVEICSSGQWGKVCHNPFATDVSGAWDGTEANVVCRQLGFGGFDPEGGIGACTETPADSQFVHINCTGTEERIQDCPGGVLKEDSCLCLDQGGTNLFGTTQCLPADCADGDIRLMDGDACNEGRVEVCTNGQWGTVCNTKPELSGAVCKSLGFPPEGALTTDVIAVGWVPIHDCTVSTSGRLNCYQITNNSCNHSMDLRVVCQTRSLAMPAEDNNSSTLSPNTEDRCICTNTVDIEAIAQLMSRPTIALGTITGVLGAVIVTMAIGWILTCIAMKRQLSKSALEKNTVQLNGTKNPAFNGNHF